MNVSEDEDMQYREYIATEQFDWKEFSDFNPTMSSIMGEEDDQDGRDDTSCKHEWKNYIGLKESFSYCTKCDEKREINGDT